jgi:catechol 2,3-dioxygenase-like lactoylglutathione lyase family enzyme
VAFYRDCLGLRELYRFADHDGFDGVMLGLPGSPHHLELTQSPGTDGAVHSKEHLLVLYLGSRDAVDAVVSRFAAAGHRPVPAENPYWEEVGAVTFEDADGWRLVLAITPGI